jgi:hypothetical protein
MPRCRNSPRAYSTVERDVFQTLVVSVSRSISL